MKLCGHFFESTLLQICYVTAGRENAHVIIQIKSFNASQSALYHNSLGLEDPTANKLLVSFSVPSASFMT